jgi:hypothetical protein
MRELEAELAFHGELGIGHHVGLFASVPLGRAVGDEYQRGGFGGIRAGALVHASFGRLALALGGGVTSDGGQPIALLYHDVQPFSSGAPVPRGFADVRLAFADGYLQLELGHSAWSYTGGETGWGNHSRSEASLGGAAAISPRAWIVGTVALAHHDGAQTKANTVSVDLGLRWQASPTADTSYAALVTCTHVDSTTIVGLAFELRADFFALGTAP